MGRFTVRSKTRQEVIDITEEVAAHVAASVGDGTLHLSTQHTTCGLTVFTKETGIAEDLLSG